MEQLRDGPKRDVLGEIRTECTQRNILFSCSSHRAEHYWFMNGGTTLKRKNATQDEAFREFYGPCVNKRKDNNLSSMFAHNKGIVPSPEWLEDWLLSSCEIIDRYRPATFYFDFWTSEEAFRPYMRKFLAYFYNRAAQHGQEVVSFYKMDAALYPCGVYVRERGQMEGVSAAKWQCETSTAYNAWSYCTTNKFKKIEEIICNMVDVWSKNGCMALNIGPKGDGSICEQETAMLETIAAWVKKNKEAIWGTGPYRVFGEGKRQPVGTFQEKYRYTKQDFRFTYRLGTLYVFALVPDGRRHFKIREVSLNALSPKGSCNAVVKAVSVLGEDIGVRFTAKESGLDIMLDQPVSGKLPICFKIILE